MKLTKDAQVLYFHLCLNADDDGAVEGFPVRRSIGIEEDAYANLVGRGFVTVLDQENEVLYINDWNEHNKIRPDRLQTSVYRNLIQSHIDGAVLIEPRQRSDVKGSKAVSVSAGREAAGPSTDGPRTDSGQTVDESGRATGGPRAGHGRALARLGKDRLGEDRLGQESLGEERQDEKDNGAHAPSRPVGFMRPSVDEIRAYCSEKGYTHVDAEYFWNYYENVGWRVGKNKMKSWKLAVANWEKRHMEFEREKRGSVPASHAQIVTRDPSESQKWGLFDD